MENQDSPFQVTAAEVARVCSGRLLHGPAEALARGISTDTRTLRRGQAFFALAGPRFDAHDYLPEAVEAGAPLLVVHRRPEGLHLPEDRTLVQVHDTERALLELAGWHRRRLHALVTAVTGSCGKSTVKDMIGLILDRKGRCTAAPASFNNRIGLARTLLSASPRDRFLVLEMGTNQPGEIDELAAAGIPHLGVITAVAPAHLEGLGDVAGVREAKAELIPWLPPEGTLVLNADDPACRGLAERFPGRVRTFGFSGQADLRPRAVHRTDSGWSFCALGREFLLPGHARYNVMNAAAALCAATAAGAAPETAAEALRGFRPAPLRYEERCLGGVRYILDCYNSNPRAVGAALRSFAHEQPPGRKALVLGDMLELGPNAADLHRDVGRAAADSEVELLVTVGPLARHMLEGWHAAALPPRRALHFRSADQAWQPLLTWLRPGDAVLLKASRRMRLEHIVEQIAEFIATPRKEAA